MLSATRLARGVRAVLGPLCLAVAVWILLAGCATGRPRVPEARPRTWRECRDAALALALAGDAAGLAGLLAERPAEPLGAPEMRRAAYCLERLEGASAPEGDSVRVLGAAGCFAVFVQRGGVWYLGEYGQRVNSM